MKDEIIATIRILEDIMTSEKIMKIINSVYKTPLWYAKKALITELGRILAEEMLE